MVRRTLVKEGCIKLLAACLFKGLLSPAAQEHASGVLAALTRDTAVHEEVVSSGGIVPLVNLLVILSA